MKYAEMKARGLLTGKPIAVPKPKTEPVKRGNGISPKFRLFRLTRPMDDGCTHAGEVWLGGKMYTITAKVADTPYGRQFVGNVEAPGAAIAKKSAPTPHPSDLVSQASLVPFDDPLPPLESVPDVSAKQPAD